MMLHMVKSRPNTNISWYSLRESHLRSREGCIVIIYVDVSEHLTGVAHRLGSIVSWWGKHSSKRLTQLVTSPPVRKQRETSAHLRSVPLFH